MAPFLAGVVFLEFFLAFGHGWLVQRRFEASLRSSVVWCS